MIRAYRITQKRYLSTAFDGEGARLHGGRWNSLGTVVVYTSGSLSLATLELLVHLHDFATIHDRYRAIPVEFDETLVQTVDVDTLPTRWNAPQLIADTQILGDTWAAAGASAALRVPSAIVPSESNYVLNPRHPDFRRIAVHPDFDLEIDPRLGSGE